MKSCEVLQCSIKRTKSGKLSGEGMNVRYVDEKISIKTSPDDQVPHIPEHEEVGPRD